ncbi:hypothetical protein Q1695_004830 [Nippostrongylus brasiliensis]|nr:hypothetical protein Q1695_004830 [Nippostrongylus brasiliensis]
MEASEKRQKMSRKSLENKRLVRVWVWVKLTMTEKKRKKNPGFVSAETLPRRMPFDWPQKGRERLQAGPYSVYCPGNDWSKEPTLFVEPSRWPGADHLIGTTTNSSETRSIGKIAKVQQKIKASFRSDYLLKSARSGRRAIDSLRKK